VHRDKDKKHERNPYGKGDEPGLPVSVEARCMEVEETMMIIVVFVIFVLLGVLGQGVVCNIVGCNGDSNNGPKNLILVLLNKLPRDVFAYPRPTNNQIHSITFL
jgi:hypothetical protein